MILKIRHFFKCVKNHDDESCIYLESYWIIQIIKNQGCTPNIKIYYRFRDDNVKDCIDLKNVLWKLEIRQKEER